MCVCQVYLMSLTLVKPGCLKPQKQVLLYLTVSADFCQFEAAVDEDLGPRGSIYLSDGLPEAMLS